MTRLPVRDPNEVLRALIVSEIEVIRSRDPELGAALNVKPATVEHEARPAVAAAGPPASLVRRALRKGYRALNRVGVLQPTLQRARTLALDRLERKNKNTTSTGPEFLTTITRSFSIAFTMRSGSNEICNLLARNGLGCPSEFFQKPLPSAGGAFVLDSFGRIVSRYQVGGIFGSKMSYEHRAVLDEQLAGALPGYTRIDDLLPNHHWVWLIRKDKILQAISWARAEATNSWASNGQRQQPRGEYPYDFLHILSRVMLVHLGELAWEQYFREHAIEPLIVFYEDFFKDVDQQLDRLIDHLGGLPATQNKIDTGATFDIQRDEKTFAVRDRFLSDLSRLGSSGMATHLGEPYLKWTRFLLEFGWRV